MQLIPASAYAGWRVTALTASFLHEHRDGTPGERLLQLVWQHQRLRPDRLHTLDGQPVRVLHPGFWNRGAGPDFRSAVLQVGPDPVRTGDVEIDLRPADWRGHQHQTNPRFAGVVLHVVWDATTPVAPLPTLPLAHALDAPLEEIMAWIDLDPGLPDHVIGRCAAGLRSLPESACVELLQQAALFRFQRKAVELGTRARHAGWEQALWEGLLAALGYQHNVWPMRRLAALRPRLAGPPATANPFALQARLFGLSGLLPHHPAPGLAAPDPYLRQLWDLWWRERSDFEAHALPRSIWHLGGLRPANHPQRRLALAAHWLARSDLPARLEQWFAQPIPRRGLVSSLLDTLQIERDEFWSWHWTLASEPMDKPQPLLGDARASDLAVNVILPWFRVRAAAGSNPALEREAERRYLEWPAAQDNAILRLARLRIFAGVPDGFPWTAARQQGLLQIVRDFCGHSNALCDQCVFPDRLATLARA